MSDQLDMVHEVGASSPREDLEVLYWIGCAAAADERVARVARSMVRIMNRAGVRFAVLGSEERCSGDPARRSGNEMLFDTLVRANLETFAKYRIERVVTHCPHCFHTFRNDYPTFGAAPLVQHHAEFIRDLLANGRLRVEGTVRETLTFHDPCYLSRHNGITEAPREVLHQIGIVPREMRRTREKSFCCGAGGAHAFFEEHVGGRINANRAREAVGTGAQVIGTACPFCLTMMEDGVRAVDPGNDVRVRDIAEIIADALQ